MKRTKLLATILTVVMIVMTLSTAILATAADPFASVTIKNNPKVTGTTIRDSQYEVYRIFDAEVIGAGVSYTVAPKFVNFFQGELTGADGEIYDFDAATALTFDALALQYVRSFGDGAVTKTIHDFSLDLMLYVQSNSIKATSISNAVEIQADSKESAVISHIPHGYYMLIGIDYPTETTVFPTSSLFTLTADREIVLKVSQPNVDKEIMHNEKGEWDSVGDNQIGDEVEFRVTANLPTNLTGYKEYTYILSDEMSAGLTYNDDVDVYFDDDLTQELPDKYYELRYVTGKAFEIKVDVMTMAKELPGLDEIYLYYTAILNEDAVVSSDREDNKIELEYSNNPYDSSTTAKAEDAVYDFTFDLDVLKVDETGVNPLADATFGLYEINKAGDEVEIFLKDLGGNVYAPSEGTFDIDAAQGYVVTDATGMYNIKGLDDETEYVIKEVKAPTGYNPINPIHFTISADYKEGTYEINSVRVDNDHISATTDGLETMIINTSSATLPETGGMGTTLFTLIGVLMMGAAVVFLVVKTKKSATN